MIAKVRHYEYAEIILDIYTGLRNYLVLCRLCGYSKINEESGAGI